MFEFNKNLIIKNYVYERWDTGYFGIVTKEASNLSACEYPITPVRIHTNISDKFAIATASILFLGHNDR